MKWSVYKRGPFYRVGHPWFLGFIKWARWWDDAILHSEDLAEAKRVCNFLNLRESKQAVFKADKWREVE